MNVSYFETTGSMADLDIKARRALSSWQELEERGAKLKAEPQALHSFQPEADIPAEVGMHELPSDEFTPEELVEMCEPSVLDWDSLQPTSLSGCC